MIVIVKVTVIVIVIVIAIVIVIVLATCVSRSCLEDSKDQDVPAAARSSVY